MRLYKAGEFIDDPWVHADLNGPIAAGVPAIVPLARWRAEPSTFADRAVRGAVLGVRLGAGEAIDASTDHLERLQLIAIDFAKFTDGRGYSTARALREQAGFKGEIRATGEVLIDQIPLMIRCGFDAFEIAHAGTLRALEQGDLPAIAEVYQPTRSAAPGARSRRRA